MLKNALLFTLLLASASTAAPSVPPSPAPSPSPKAEDADEPPRPAVSDHQVTIGGTTVKYRATAGYIVLKDFSEKQKKGEDGGGKDKDEKDKKPDKNPKALAKMFFVAYTRTGVTDEKRPIAFCFNGGPGSSSVWLHMGALGPRRAALTDMGEALPPPARVEDNPYSWLDATDLVFIDPVSTGFSRPEKGEDPGQFHGYDEDIESVGEFIRLYTSKNKRWASPKFLVGESYGTVRASGLADYMQHRYGMYFNGIVLVSAVLQWATIDFTAGNDMPYPVFLPTYAASAWYHQRLAPELQKLSLDELLKQVEEFATHDYQQALFEGDRLDPARKKAVAERVAKFTGLSPSWVAQVDNRVIDEHFFTHLLMDKDREIGRFDARYSAPRYHPGREESDFDASFEAVNGPFASAVNDYLQRDLGVESELPYETLTGVGPWKWKHAQNRYLNVAETLKHAMTRNPYLKVWVCCGRYDLATPYFGSQLTVDRMQLDPSVRGNVRLTYYDAGHMIYVHRPSLQKFRADFEQFLKDAVLPDSAAVPSTRP